jgi:dienelactone hydrolase
MKICIAFLLLFSISSCFAQISKPPIDTNVFNKWSSVGAGMITNDGKYALYNIDNEPVGSRTLVIKSLKTSWEAKLANSGDGRFVDSNKLVLFQRKDSICLYSLVNMEMECIGNVKSWRIWEDGKSGYLICLLNNPEKSMILRKIGSSVVREFTAVNDFRVYNDGSAILLNRILKGNHVLKQTLDEVNTSRFELKTLWTTDDSIARINLNSLALDNNHRQIAFSVTKNNMNTIWYYNFDSNESKSLDRDSAADISDPGFSVDGKHLFVSLQKDNILIQPPGPVGVDIWNYKDKKLQSQQLYETQHEAWGQQEPMAVITIADGVVTRLTYNNEHIFLFPRSNDLLGLIIHYGEANSAERNWNSAARNSSYLIYTKTLKSRNEINFGYPKMSPGGRYIYGFDSVYQFLYLYDLSTGIKINISDRMPKLEQLDEDYDQPGSRPSGLTVAAWMACDSAILIYDKYDIWKVGIIGNRKAINVTKSYGRSHHLILRLIGNYRGNDIINDTTSYVLSALNEYTIQRGFISWSMKKRTDLQILSMRSNSCEMQYSSTSLHDSYLIDNSKIITLVKCESSARSPNYFVTNDFRKFDTVSAVFPEKKYNWMTSEVIHFNLSNGSQCTGVLYKPENFDPKKKYPVLITYYEKLSQHANDYKTPGYAHDNINIPWFVSRGYIVFTPDINYKIGHPLQGAYLAIVGGAEYLFRYPWVDPKKIALQGHSWGAFETDYIITHSHLFCAALSASGVCDFISGYGATMKEGNSLQWFYEIDQMRIGATPWERPDLYVENSAVLHADEVTTPLLMMNNKEDAVVPFSQGIEFFTALRRQKKRVWMLQYDQQAHSVNGEASVDYTIRMTQFFDHYCMDAPAPIWMTKGVPARLKGIDNGFEIDHSGQEP